MGLRFKRSLLVATLFPFWFSCTGEERLPNVVFIMTDDLGYGDVSSYNTDSKVRTPHIDRLISEGMKFIDAHTSSAVCTPSQYSLLTGRLEKGGFLSDGDDWLDRGYLFNLKDDPYETNDVYEEFPKVVKSLKKRFLQSGAVSL